MSCLLSNSLLVARVVQSVCRFAMRLAVQIAPGIALMVMQALLPSSFSACCCSEIHIPIQSDSIAATASERWASVTACRGAVGVTRPTVTIDCQGAGRHHYNCTITQLGSTTSTAREKQKIWGLQQWETAGQHVRQEALVAVPEWPVPRSGQHCNFQREPGFDSRVSGLLLCWS